MAGFKMFAVFNNVNKTDIHFRLYCQQNLYNTQNQHLTMEMVIK